MKKKFTYICDFQLPTTSAYAIHVSKMCEAFAKINYDVTLICPNSSISLNKFFKDFNLKEKIKIKSIFRNPVNLHFFNKVIYSLKIFFFLKNEKNEGNILSRSVLPSIILSFFGIKNILEIHHQLFGITKVFYKIFKDLNFLKNLRYILLHKSLVRDFVKKYNKYIILDDAVSLTDFKIKKKYKKEKNTCVYVGSFYKGKGFEFIMELANKCKKIRFHLYGDKKFLIKKNFKILKNVKIFDYIPYSKVPSVLSRYDIALMPFSKRIYGRGNIDISKSISPLKMFDYMASGKIIIASELKIYEHILKNKHNSILIKSNNPIKWKENIEKIFKNPKKYKKISINAYHNVKKYTWDARVKKIKKKFLIN